MSIGDIRHVLMTMAHGEGIVGEVVRLFNWRLSEDGDDDELIREIDSFISMQHPRIASVDPSLRDVIVHYIEVFWLQQPGAHVLYDGSIGKFVLMGAYPAHRNDMNAAIYVFRTLCGIKGRVWPVSLENDIHIGATLEGGRQIRGQDRVTTLRRPDERMTIRSTHLMHDLNESEDFRPEVVDANPLILETMNGQLNVVVFGPGSFFTSVLPHLMVRVVVDRPAGMNVPKLFIGNMREGNECFGLQLLQLVSLFLDTCNRFASDSRPANRYLTHIVAHDSSSHQRSLRGDRCLELGEDIRWFEHMGITLTIADFEDPWRRGHHDANVPAELIANV